MRPFFFVFLFSLSFWCEAVAQAPRDSVNAQPVVFSSGDKVGVVLSGGGAAGLAHIGVLKALEQNHIPIDYICGTSMGALVGCLYAMGYSPDEIEKLCTSEEFKSWATGYVQPNNIYYFKKKEDNASWIDFRLSLDTTLITSLPTNLISPVQIDFALMQRTAAASAAAHYQFDSLFIPFRCVASDVENKQSVIFKNGDLGIAVRSSLAYPFYLKPILLDGKLLYDGGLYNNFPADVMYKDFFPDFIIGSNVASGFPKPDEDNLMSQIRTMLTSKTDFDPKCENGIVVEPDVDHFALFDFDHVQAMIDSGYNATMRRMDEIKFEIKRRSDPSVLAAMRAAFKAKEVPLVFDNIDIEGQGMKKRQVAYVRHLLRQKKTYVDINHLSPGYFRLAADDKIKSIFPQAQYNATTGYYDLKLTIRKQHNVTTQFGGNISNRPINFGYFGFKYDLLGLPSFTFSGNVYFGKLYSSAQLSTRVDFPTRLPFYLEPVFTWNRFDYYRSSPAFFEDTKPPFLINNDRCGELDVGFPVRNKGRIVIGSGYAFLRNLYYQTENFTSADTADRTDMSAVTTHLFYERNTLNRKQFASAGTYLAFKARYVQGEEFYQPGTTANDRNATFRKIHEWVQFRFIYDTYFKERGRWRLGFYCDFVYSTQPLYSNYTASILSSPAFEPTPESKTFFIPQFRAHKFAGGGLKSIFVLWKTIDFRLEGYAFLPYEAIIENNDLTASYAAPLSISTLSYIGTSAFVWHSPLGPMSLSLNYYSPKSNSFSVLFSFGYIIFNRKATE